MLRLQNFRRARHGVVRDSAPRSIVAHAQVSAANVSRDRGELIDRLNSLLADPEVCVETRRAKVKPLRVLHLTRANASHSKARNVPRCRTLDMDILWEADEKASPGKVVQGLARVKLFKGLDNCDRVVITDIQTMGESDGEAPCMPSTNPASSDVLLAVQNLDSVVLERLNDFLWEVEQNQSFPLSSFDMEDDEDEMVDQSTYQTDYSNTQQRNY